MRGQAICSPGTLRSPTHIPLLEGREFESFELTERPFSAPRDDTARASCGNGAKRNFLPHIAA